MIMCRGGGEGRIRQNHLPSAVLTRHRGDDHFFLSQPCSLMSFSISTAGPKSGARDLKLNEILEGAVHIPYFVFFRADFVGGKAP